MKYKIWDTRYKRYVDDMTILQDGSMIRGNGIKMFDRDDKDGSISRDDFEVQWVKEPADDVVDPKVWEDHKRKEDLKRMVGGLIEALSHLRGMIIKVESRLMVIIDENKC